MLVRRIRMGLKDQSLGQIVIGDVTVLFYRDRMNASSILVGVKAPTETKIEFENDMPQDDVSRLKNNPLIDHR